MKPISILIVTLGSLGILSVLGGSYWLHEGVAPKPSPKATPPPPSTFFHESQEPAPSAAQIAPEAARHNDLLALEIERALVSRDSMQRETAFTYLLPELLQGEPARVVAMFDRQEPGEARDTLRSEIARLWITKDRDAAIEWLRSLDAPEQRAGAGVAVDSLAASAPAQAIQLADQFGIGRDDGYLEHLVQIWATENLDDAERWIATQPEGPKTEQLRARIELVREQQKAARG